ncbi:MAG: GntR family transcriptional regulator [Burkholderiales bacterium]|nr:MAG: GntR family transcriptional regulator [Burkholderiales bacterium]
MREAQLVPGAGALARLSRYLSEELATQGRTKRAAVRFAIVRAIRSGDLRPGQWLPAEGRLAERLGVSLGTVQAALTELQQSAVIVRRRGQGSRIASTESPERDVWHFRFQSLDDGLPVRLFVDWARVGLTEEPGPAAAAFFGSPAARRFVRIARRMLAEGTPAVGAEMFIDAACAPGLERLPRGELAAISIRPYLQRRYGITTAGADHSVRVCSLEAGTAREFGLRRRGKYFEVHARAYDEACRPVYFQRIYAPIDHYVPNFVSGAV